MGYADIAAYFSRWIDTTASAIVSLLSSVRAGKTVQVIEEDTGSFVIQSDRAAPSGLPFERVQIIDGKLAGAHPDSIIAHAQWQPGGTEAAACPRAVPPARVAAARDRVSRRRGPRSRSIA